MADEADEAPSGELGGWSGYRRLVIAELQRLDNSIKSVDRKIDITMSAMSTRLNSMETELALLKFKSSLWGALMGAAASGIVAVAAWLLHAK